MHFEKHWEMEEDIFLTNRKWKKRNKNSTVFS
jgi:hypothetical protein